MRSFFIAILISASKVFTQDSKERTEIFVCLIFYEKFHYWILSSKSYVTWSLPKISCSWLAAERTEKFIIEIRASQNLNLKMKFQKNREKNESTLSKLLWDYVNQRYLTNNFIYKDMVTNPSLLYLVLNARNINVDFFTLQSIFDILWWLK